MLIHLEFCLHPVKDNSSRTVVDKLVIAFAISLRLCIDLISLSLYGLTCVFRVREVDKRVSQVLNTLLSDDRLCSC